MTKPDAEIVDLLNAQTALISWQELARHFARGVVICVHRDKDLLRVAESLVQDRSEEVARLHEQGLLHRARDEDAIRWQQQGTEFWAVVVAPWVLVQEGTADPDD